MGTKKNSHTDPICFRFESDFRFSMNVFKNKKRWKNKKTLKKRALNKKHKNVFYIYDSQRAHASHYRDGKKNKNPARTNRSRTQVLPRTEPNPKVKKCTRARTEPYPVQNWTESRTQMSSFLLESFTERNCRYIIPYIHTFHSKSGILLYLG